MPDPKPSLPDANAPSTAGRLVYAVGDVHGRADLLEALVAKLAEDALKSRPRQRPLLILLGDYIDRGPDSASVLDLLVRLRSGSAFEVHALKGNHEDAVLKFLRDPNFGPTWVQHGGLQTLASYGVPPPSGTPAPETWSAIREAFEAALPPAHRELLDTLKMMIIVGSYVFVHAGLRPELPIDEQTTRDLMWIRQEFLSFDGSFGKIVVHGHSPAEQPQILANRIGVDTGAYATGRLTAVRLYDDQRTMLQTRGNVR